MDVAHTLTLELSRADQVEDAHAVPSGPQAYIVRRDRGFGSATFPWGDRVATALAELEKPEPDRGVLQGLGDTLRTFVEEALRSLEGWGSHEDAIRQAADAGKAAHLTLRFAAAELYALPWELMTLRATGQCLGELKSCLVQYEWPGTNSAPARASAAPEQSRLLFGWSAAGGTVPAAEHLRALREAGGRVELDPEGDVLADLSLASLERALAEASSAGRPFAALHVLCHGGATEGGTWGLRWNGARTAGPAELVDGAGLRRVLAPHRDSLRLVVLCACQGGHATAGNALGSICQALHRVGIQAVVASRLPLSKRGSVAFAEAFYGPLLTGTTSLQFAFLAARARLAQLPGFDWAALQLYARAGDGPDLRPLVFCPFPGLECFEEEDARFYFGRDAELREAAAYLDPAAPVPRRWLQVEGPSGAGKSSFVRAGLVPAIRRGAIRGGPPQWRVGILRPGRDPLHQLALALVELLSLGSERTAEVEAALRAPDGLAVLVGREAKPGVGLLLVVDQMEEVFALPQADAGAMSHFDELLARALETPGPLHLVTTIRSDFLGRFTELPRLEGALNARAARYYLRQMAPHALVDAFLESAAAAGLTWEAGLPSRIAADAAKASGSLPLVGHTLRELWKRREGSALTHAAYVELGGVRGALTRSAESLLSTFSPEEQERIRRLFLDMVTSGRGTKDVRRVVPLEEAVRIAGGGAEGQALIARLSGGRAPDTPPSSPAPPRLLVVGEDTADLAHEALLDDWQTLRGWIDAERKNLERRDDLEAAAALWVSGGSHEDGLPAGAQLAYLRGAEPVTERARSFLQAALAREQREVDLKLRRARAARRRLALAAGAAGGTAVLMFVLWQQAIASEDRARTNALLAGAGQELVRGDPAVADRLLLEVEDPEHAPGWMALAHEVLLLPTPKVTLRHDGRLIGAWFSPDGKHILTSSWDGIARVWPADGRGSPVVLRGPAGDMSSSQKPAAFSPDGQYVATAYRDGTARIWRADGAGQPVVLRGHTKKVNFVTFSPDGQFVATSSEDHTARVWRVDGTGTPVVLDTGASVRTINFSPDGRRVVTGCFSGIAKVWSVDGAGAPVVLKGPDQDMQKLWSASFSPDGQLVVTTYDGGAVRLWKADGTGGPVALEGQQGTVESAQFSPDGRRILAISREGIARIWPVDGQGPAVVLAGHSGAASACAFSPDGQRVVTGSSDGTARIWMADGKGEPIVLKAHTGEVNSASFSPDGRWVVTGSSDATARIWRADGKGEAVALKGHEGAVSSAVFHPDGEHVLTAGWDNTARVWRADGAGEPVVLQGHTGEVWSAAFSPDGKRVVTASKDFTARVWNADGTGEPLVLKGHTNILRYAAFSPDGRWVVTTSQDWTARVWNADGTGEPKVFKPHTDAIWCAALSADGARMATASQDMTAKLWRLDGTGAPVVFRGHMGEVRFVAFSPDEKRVVTASADGTARVWNADGTGEPVVLRGHAGTLISALFSPDGKRVVTASLDGTARVWNADGAGEPVVLKGHSGGVRFASFSPDGERVVTASQDKTARIWTLSYATVREQLRRTNDDCLTVEVRQKYLVEGESTARRNYEACERAHGRAP